MESHDLEDEKQETNPKEDTTNTTDGTTTDKPNNNNNNNNKKKKQRKVHKLSLTATDNYNTKLQKRGVVYLSRIPPRMGPTKIKSLLNEFGNVTRIYLEQEDKSARKRRIRASGSNNNSGGGGKRYTEGWVEFEDKAVAKHVASSLNTTPISVQKRSVHHGDLWSIKYLSKFQWSFLTEKVAYERRVREQRLRIEMIQAKKEKALYSDMVESGKSVDRIQKRKEKMKKNQQQQQQQQEGVGTKRRLDKQDEKLSKSRKFRQTSAIDTDYGDVSLKSPVLNSLV